MWLQRKVSNNVTNSKKNCRVEQVYISDYTFIAGMVLGDIIAFGVFFSPVLKISRFNWQCFFLKFATLLSVYFDDLVLL